MESDGTFHVFLCSSWTRKCAIFFVAMLITIIAYSILVADFSPGDPNKCFSPFFGKYSVFQPIEVENENKVAPTTTETNAQTTKPTSETTPQPLPPAENPSNEIPRILEDMLENVQIRYRERSTKYSKEIDSKRCDSVKGRRILINYASNCCRQSQPLNCKTGLEIGGFDVCISFNETSVDGDFKRRNGLAMSKPIGGGLWLWKSYIIFKTLLAMDDDDVLLYSDSGCRFIENMDAAHVCLQHEFKQDIVLFAYDGMEPRYSKGDAFFLINCPITDAVCSNTTQFLGSPILLRKTLRSIQFVSQWLTYAQDYRILGNEPSTIRPEDSTFVANRNDQTVLSLLAKKWKITPWPDPSQWGEDAFGQSLRKQPRFYKISKTFMDLTRDKS